MEQVIEPTLENSISDLRASLRGEALLPGEQGADQAKAAWNLLVQHQPQLIVLAKSEADVQAAIAYANRHDLPVAVQATGHGQFRTLEGGMLINVSGLNQAKVDVETKTVRVGGGARWQDVIDVATPYNLFPISGSAPHVGVVGYTIGGGYGIVSRKYGFGVDQVLSFRIVDPQGEVREVSPTQDADVYWAVLGGGGSFGVITEITIQLHDHPAMFGGTVMFDASLASEIYPAYLEFTKQATEEVSSALTMITYPPLPMIPEFLHGRSMLIFSAAVIGEDAEELLSSIRSRAGAEFDSFRPMTYAESHAVYQDPVDPLPATTRGVLLKDLDREILNKALAAVGTPAQAPNLIFRIRHLGGAMSRSGPHSNSIGRNREANYLIYFIGVPMGPHSVEDMYRHAEGVIESVQSVTLSRGPLNWLGVGDVTKAEVAGTFNGEELARQVAVKQTVDPQNRFRFAGVGLD